jgi:hypothetical protein
MLLLITHSSDWPPSCTSGRHGARLSEVLIRRSPEGVHLGHAVRHAPHHGSGCHGSPHPRHPDGRARHRDRVNPVRTFEYSVGGVTMKVPTGCMFTHIIRGSGRRITYQNAGVDCAFVGALSTGFCNWRIHRIPSGCRTLPRARDAPTVEVWASGALGEAWLAAGMAEHEPERMLFLGGGAGPRHISRHTGSSR